jgi:hypothetical protein
VLEHDPVEPFQRAEDGSVNHHRSLLRTIGIDIAEAEAFRHHEIELDRGKLPGPTHGVGDEKSIFGP